MPTRRDFLRAAAGAAAIPIVGFSPVSPVDLRQPFTYVELVDPMASDVAYRQEMKGIVGLWMGQKVPPGWAIMDGISNAAGSGIDMRT